MTIHDEIKRHMALAFFGCAYADQADECEQPLTGEIMEQLPADIDSSALHAADTLAADLMRANGLTMGAIFDLESLYLRAEEIQHNSDDKGDRELTPELFGHYLAMQALGTGVGLESFGNAVRDAITVPYIEFGSHSLEKDYFEGGDE